MWKQNFRTIKAGKDVSYDEETGMYTLTNSSAGVSNIKRYSCESTTDISCSKVRYYIYAFDTGARGYVADYILYSNGEKFSDEVERANDNINDSKAKIQIDSWFESNMLSYLNYLEDTQWCNDRSRQNGSYNLPLSLSDNEFSSRLRWYYKTQPPILSCPIENDRLTVDEENGTGTLKYPVAMLTADEVLMAGTALNTSTGTYYTLTPSYYSFVSIGNEQGIVMDGSGVSLAFALRPSISLNNDSIIDSGDGTSQTPFLITKEYKVNIEEDNGTKEIVIEVNDTKTVVYEDKVVFTVVPEEGYEIETIEIIDKEGNKIEYKKTNNENEYEFIMPDTDVTIKPIYRKIESIIDTEPEKKIEIEDNPNTGDKIMLLIMTLVIVFGIVFIANRKSVQKYERLN